MTALGSKKLFIAYADGDSGWASVAALLSPSPPILVSHLKRGGCERTMIGYPILSLLARVCVCE